MRCKMHRILIRGGYGGSLLQHMLHDTAHPVNRRYVYIFVVIILQKKFVRIGSSWFGYKIQHYFINKHVLCEKNTFGEIRKRGVVRGIRTV